MNKVLIVPYWVRDSLWRGGHKIGDLLSFDKTLQILSRREVAILQSLQSSKYAITIFGATLGDYGLDLCQYWRDNTHSSRKEELDKLCKYIGDNCCDDEINARLFGENIAITRDDEHVVTEVSGFGIAITITPKFFTKENIKVNNAALSREVAKFLYRYESMSNIMQAPFGTKYIETLLQ